MSEDTISKSAFMKVLALAEMRLAVLEHCQRWDALDPDRSYEYRPFMDETGQALERLYQVRGRHDCPDMVIDLPKTIRNILDKLFTLDENMPDVWSRPLFDPTIADFRETANELRRRHFRQHDAKLILYAHALESTLMSRAVSSRQHGYILAGLSFAGVANFFDPPLLISCLVAAGVYSARTVATTHQSFKDPRPLAEKVWELVNNPERLAPQRQQLADATQWSFGRIEETIKVPDNTPHLIRYMEGLPGYQPTNPCRAVFSTQPIP